MSSKNDARRLKKKAERAKNRAIVVKEKLRILKAGSSGKEQFTNSVRKSILDSLTIVGIMDQTLFTMSRLKTLGRNIIAKNPTYHTEELNKKFAAVVHDADLTIQDMQKMREIFVKYSEQLENPNITMTELSDTATKIQQLKTNENELMDSCSDAAKQLVALVDESNKLIEQVKAEADEQGRTLDADSVCPVLNTEEYKLLCIYAGLDVNTIPVIGNKEVPLRSGFMRPADEPSGKSAADVTTYTSEYKVTSNDPNIQQVLTDYATDAVSESDSEHHVESSTSANIE